MIIGITALTHQLEEAINICKGNKYINHIEIGIDNIDECDIVKMHLDEINNNNISIGIHLPMELNTCENINYIKESWVNFVIEIQGALSKIEIKYFNMHLGYAITSRYSKDKYKYLDNSIEFIRNLSPHIDCSLFIENTYTQGGDICNIGTLSDEFEYIFNNVDVCSVQFCYDTGHNLINYDEYLNKLNDKINLVHLSDNDGKTDMHIGIGKGQFNLYGLEKTLKINPKNLILEVQYCDLDYSLDILKQFID